MTEQVQAPTATVDVQMAPTEEPLEPTEEVQVTPLPPIPGRKMAISFKRSIQPKQYENAECFASVSFDLPEDFPIERVSELVEKEYMMLRSGVYQQLGIPFTLDETTKALIEQMGGTVVAAQANPQAANAFAGTGFNPPPPAAAPAQQAQGFAAPPQGNPFPQAAAPPAQGPVPGWTELMADPSQWEDVRQTKTKPTQPDFKHRTFPNPKNPQYKLGLWINDKTPFEVKQWLGLTQ